MIVRFHDYISISLKLCHLFFSDLLHHSMIEVCALAAPVYIAVVALWA